jgi:serine/threonine-protein kinase RsbW
MSPSTLTTEIRIPALPDFVGVVRLVISGLLARMNFTAEEVEDIKVALSEACSNAVQYAYPKTNPDRRFIDIKVIQKSKSIEIVISDKGIGFNPGKPPRRKLHDADIHMGLGIIFMKNLMDKVEINSQKNKGTTVTLTKKIKN